MQKACVRCGTLFESVTKKLTCSETCRVRKIVAEKAQWRRDNKPSVKRSNQRTSVSRRDSGQQHAYQVKRRASRAGYIDRFLERIRTMNPASDILRQDLESLFGENCSVTNVPFKYGKLVGAYSINPYAPSIDRIDSTQPYQVGNIQIVLTAVNYAKNAMSMDDFTKVWKEISHSWAALTNQ